MIESTRLTDTVALTVEPTQPRQTPPPPSRRFAEALETGVGLLVREAAGSAGSLPGGAILSAATRALPGVRGAGAVVTGGERPEAPGSAGEPEGRAGGVDDYWKLQQQSQEFNLQFLQLQEGLSQENRRFSALSNVLKARHDTSKAVIQNIR